LNKGAPVQTDLVRTGTEVKTQPETGIPAAPPPAKNPVLERLHALVRRGYRAEIGKAPGSDTVLLRHLGKAHDLLLHSDGRLEPAPGRIPRHKSRVPLPVPFAPDDVAEQLRFMSYLDTLRRPSLRDRTRRLRHRFVYLPVVLAILIGLHLAFTAILIGG
jgi:hypothetical protein